MDGSDTQPLSGREKRSAALFFLLANLAIAPTFWRGNPCGHDITTHFWRTVMFTFNIQDGYPFLQWGQHFLRGYGYPIFPFYAPLFNWLIALLHLSGLDFNVALRLAAWLAFLLCGWGMYTLGRRYLLSPAAAAVAGLAYMFAPYIIYDGVERGALPELFALGLLPWVLARVDIALERRTTRETVKAIFAFGLLILTHNIIPLIGFLLAGALWLGRFRRHRLQQWFSDARQTILIIFGALLLTAFFWLPALVELDYTQQGRGLDSPFADWPVWYQHFLPENELIALPADPADPQLGNPPQVRTLGMVQAAAAALGLLTLFWHKEKRGVFLVWGTIILVAIFLSNANASLLWEILPLPTFVQLPTRLLGIASLGLAVLTGRFADELQRLPRPVSWSATAVLPLAVCLLGTPWLTRPYCPLPDNPDVLTLATAARWSEHFVSQWGGANGAETLPRWADALPDPEGLIPQYEAGGPVNRLILPENATLDEWSTRPNGSSYQLELAAPAVVTYQTFYLPGWQATVNGQNVPITPSETVGFITVPLPAGEVTLEIRFGRTPLRWAMIGISVVALAGLLWLGRKRGKQWQPRPFMLKQQMPLLGLILLLILSGRAAVALTDNPLHATRLENGQLTQTDLTHTINFSNELLNLGVRGPLSAHADETLAFTQYWTPVSTIGVPYDFDLRLADDNGRQWSLPARRPVFHVDIPGVNGWQQGVYMRDPYLLELLPGTPPGRYWLETTAFRRDITFALTAENTPTAPDPAWARLGQIEILPAQTPPRLTPETAAVDNVHQQPLATIPELTLYGSSLISFPPIRPSDEIVLELLWQANGQINTAAEIELILQNASGQTVTTDTLIVGDDYTTNLWREGDVVRQQSSWQVPRELESGRYTLLLDNTPLGTFEVVAPERQLERPPTEQAAEIAFGFAQLSGYTLPEITAGHPFTLELLWQARETTDTNYRVFVHLRDEHGAIIAQSDAEPAQWSRPTRGWLPPEFITDPHTLTLPPDQPAGEYQLIVGLYNPATMERLGESVLTTVTLE